MNYSNVTIEQLQKLTSSIKLRGDNRYELGMDILDIFEGRDRKELKAMSVIEFDKLLTKYRFLTTDEIVNDKWVKEFEFEEVRYLVNQTPETWNVGQWISIGELTKDTDNIINSLHMIIAVMCEKDDTKVIETSQRFKNLSVEVAYPLGLFFCAVMSLLPPNMLDYLKVVYLPHSAGSGDGMM